MLPIAFEAPPYIKAKTWTLHLGIEASALSGSICCPHIMRNAAAQPATFLSTLERSPEQPVGPALVMDNKSGSGWMTPFLINGSISHSWKGNSWGYMNDHISFMTRKCDNRRKMKRKIARNAMGRQGSKKVPQCSPLPVSDSFLHLPGNPKDSPNLWHLRILPVPTQTPLDGRLQPLAYGSSLCH